MVSAGNKGFGIHAQAAAQVQRCHCGPEPQSIFVLWLVSCGMGAWIPPDQVRGRLVEPRMTSYGRDDKRYRLLKAAGCVKRHQRRLWQHRQLCF